MAPRSSYHHGDLRRALLEAAVVLVERSGVDGFSLREAARVVGVSATAAYRHFADRSALLGAVAVEGFSALADAMVEARDAVSSGSPAARARGRFVAVGRAYVEFALTRPAWFTVMFGAVAARPRVRGRAHAIDRDPYELLGDALDELVAVGALPRTRRAGAEAKAWAAVHGVATLLRDGALRCRDRDERAAIVTAVVEFAADGVCVSPPAKGTGGRR